MIKNGITQVAPEPEIETAEVRGNVAEIRSSVMDGDTWYFIRLENQEVYYLINGREYPLATILNAGDRVVITYEKGTGEMLNAISLER